MILVAGPPCGGKTTYVAEHAAPSDSVLDFDDIVERITGERYARSPHVIEQARAEWSRLLPQSQWVIWTAPRRAQRGQLRSRYGATVIVVTADPTECLRRATAERPPSWQDLIQQWFAEWEPSRSGQELIVDTTHSEATMANPRYANGHRRRNLRTRVLHEETHCGICGHEVDKTIPTPDPMSAEVDEIMPIALGGDPLDRRNAQLTHRICNACKSIGQHQGFCPWCIANGQPTQAGTTNYLTSRTW